MDPQRSGLIAGATSLGAALRMLRSHSELWIWCALPFLVNVAMFALAIVVFLHYWDPLSASVEQLLPTTQPETWYHWLWQGPLRVLAWLVKWILVMFFGLAVYFLFTLVGGVLAAPFLDVLSRRVERLRTSRVSEPVSAGFVSELRGALRAVLEEGKRMLFFVSGQLVFLLIGWVPGLQPLAVLGALLFSVLFMPLDYTGYLLDRRRVRFRTRRSWIWRHRRAMLGFGAAALGTFLVPGLNFVCLPWLVTAGTLLALDLGVPPSDDPLTSASA